MQTLRHGRNLGAHEGLLVGLKDDLANCSATQKRKDCAFLGGDLLT